MSERKNIMQDLRVIAAVEALKRAVLAVNGDKAVVSEIIYFDVVEGTGSKGCSVLGMNICSCPRCITRATGMLNEEFEAAKARRRAGEAKVVH